MLTRFSTNRRSVLVASRVLRVCAYHTYPEPGEVPVITESRSSTPKRLDKSIGPWSQELIEIKKKFDITTQFPGFEGVSGNAKTQAAPQPEMTKLDNGLTVVSIDNAEKVMTSFAFLINSGSSSENQTHNTDSNTGGITNILEALAFGPSAGSEDIRSEEDGEIETVSRKLNRIGAIEQVTSSREHICYFVDVIHDSAEEGIKLLADAVLRPSITSDSIKLAVQNLAFRNNYMPAEMLSRDAMSIAAYKGTPLGNFHFPTNMLQLGLHNPEKIQNFRRSVLNGENCVFAAAGIEHENFVAMAKKFFDERNLAPSPDSKKPKASSSYTGGLYIEQRQLQEPFIKLAVGFETGGYKSENLYTICVLDKILGGGSSFSAGGPGKGMYTRLYLDVLNMHHWIESAQSFVVPHENNGILGIDAACEAENIQYLYQVILNQFLRLATEDVTAVELSRAKNMLRSQLMMQLESRLVVCEDIARQYATFGKRELPQKTCASIENVTVADIRKLAKDMLMQPPAVVCLGENVSHMPSYDQIYDFTKKKIEQSGLESPP